MKKQLYLTVKQHYFIKYNCWPLPYLRFWITTPNYLKVCIRHCKREADYVHCK